MAGPGTTPQADGQLRASYADRERATHTLKQAFAEGRLDQDELGERVSQVYASRYRGELAALTADLPSESAESSAGSPGSCIAAAEAPGRETSALTVAGLILAVAAVGLFFVTPAAAPVVLLGAVALVQTGRIRRGRRWLGLAGIGLVLIGALGFAGYIPFLHFG
jgi:hypothetical protein